MSKLQSLFEQAEDLEPDRSAATYRIVMKGLEAGDDDQKVLLSASKHSASVEKYGSRLADEVTRILGKERHRHPHVGRSCVQASCGREASPAMASPVTAVDWTQLWAGDDKPPEYVLEPLLPAGRTTTLVSPPKVGKSLLGLEIAVAVATGKGMWGQEVQQRCVMYLDQEMSQADLRERLQDMGYGPDDDLSGLHYYLQEPWAALDTAEGGQLLLDAIANCGAEVLIIDTQSKVLEGEENDAGTMTRFFRFTLGPLKAHGKTVLLFDHVGRDAAKGPRGSSQKPADVDAVWVLSIRGEARLTLTRTHNRTRHGDGVLYLERSGDPLRHKLVTSDERAEEVIEVMIRQMERLDLDPALSARAALKLAKEDGLTGRLETQREAYRRYQQASFG